MEEKVNAVMITASLAEPGWCEGRGVSVSGHREWGRESRRQASEKEITINMKINHWLIGNLAMLLRSAATSRPPGELNPLVFFWDSLKKSFILDSPCSSKNVYWIPSDGTPSWTMSTVLETPLREVLYPPQERNFEGELLKILGPSKCREGTKRERSLSLRHQRACIIPLLGYRRLHSLPAGLATVAPAGA